MALGSPTQSPCQDGLLFVVGLGLRVLVRCALL